MQCHSFPIQEAYEGGGWCRVNPKQGDIWWIEEDEVYQQIESSNLFMSSVIYAFLNNVIN